MALARPQISAEWERWRLWATFLAAQRELQQDLADLRAQVEQLRGQLWRQSQQFAHDLEVLRAQMRDQIVTAVRRELDAEKMRFRTQIDIELRRLEARLVTKIGGLAVGSAMLTLAAAYLLS